MPLSLVAFYGEKPPALARLIRRLQLDLEEELEGAFRPYAPEQVHGTIIGLELLRRSGVWYSQWCLENQTVASPADLQGFLHFLRREFSPVRIQFGGFRAGHDYGFTSRSQHPFERSITIGGSQAVLMGWPLGPEAAADRYADRIYHVRKAAEAYQVCHKWHRDGYRDNDCYLVLGSIDQTAVAPEERMRAEQMLRRRLAERAEVIILGIEHLSVAVYRDTGLSPEHTRIFPLSNPDLSIEDLLSLA